MNGLVRRLGGEAKREQKVSPGVQNDAKKGPKMRSGGGEARSEKGQTKGPKKVASGSPGGAKMEPKWSQK